MLERERLTKKVEDENSESDGVVGSAGGGGEIHADCVDYFGRTRSLGDFCCGGEGFSESVAGDRDGYDCVCGWVVFGGGGEYVFWSGASWVCVSGGVADIFGDLAGAGDCGGGGVEMATVGEEKLSSAAEAAFSRLGFMLGLKVQPPKTDGAFYVGVKH
jgi:hypothetical protein